MKILTVKINNYKSLGEKDNLLFLSNINNIIGKNESGKTNVIEAIYDLDFSGIESEEYFNKVNKISLKKPVIEVVLEPYEKEYLKYGDLEQTIVIFTDLFDISISGGLPKILIKDKTLTYLREEIINYHNKVNIAWADQNSANKFEKFISAIKNIDNKILINYAYIDELLDRLKILANNPHHEFLEKIKELRKKLLIYYEVLPKIIFLDNESIKSSYSVDELKINNDNTRLFKKLLKISNINYDEFMNLWVLNDSAVQLQKIKQFNRKLQVIASKFNEFYSQEKISLEIMMKSSSIEIILDTTDLSINFMERSQGLRWYFNLYIKLLSSGNTEENVVFIMDEPGVFLHVNAQKELIKCFNDLSLKNNQVIYTTHSPYMIDQERLENLRIVTKDSKGYTHISNKYHHISSTNKGKMDTLTPIIDAIGFDIKYNFGPEFNKTNIVVEGISDYNYIKGFLLSDKELSEKINIIPSTGANNINRIVSILIGWGCNYRVILDNDSQGRKEYTVLTNKLLVQDNEISFTDGTSKYDVNKNHTIENVFSSSDYFNIVAKENYESLKSPYSLEILNKIKNSEFVYSNETLDNFKKIFNNLGI